MKKLDEATLLKRMCTLIKEERKSRGITQVELTKTLGITQGNLSKIENAEFAPTSIVWLRFCTAFDIPASLPVQKARFEKYLRQVRAKRKPSFTLDTKEA